MENMNPCMVLLIYVRRHLDRGQSVRMAIAEYLRFERGDFPSEVGQWFSLWQQGLETEAILHRQSSLYRRILLQTLERGLSGEPIYGFLQTFEQELMNACQNSLSESLGRLPFMLLVPLLFLQMPAFLLLLLGPLLGRFLEALGGP